jgi:hypothetical protein
MVRAVNRILFIGADTLGTDAVYVTKRRLSRIHLAEEPLLVDLDHNAQQFIVLPESIPPGPWRHAQRRVFTRRTVSGEDDELFEQQMETVALDQGPGAFGEIFYAAMTRLANIDKAAFRDRTNIDISAYYPAVVLVIDAAIWNKNTWREWLEPIVSPSLPALCQQNGRRYPLYVLLHTGRGEADRNAAADLAGMVNGLFLIGDDSNLVLGEDDQVDLAANFLQMTALLEGQRITSFLDPSQHGRCYSVGASHLHFSRPEIVEEALPLCLGDDTSFRHKVMRQRHADFYRTRMSDQAPEGSIPFRDFYIGLFKTVPEELAGQWDIEKSIHSSRPPVTEFMPSVRRKIDNLAGDLAGRMNKWLENSTERIGAELARGGFVDRLKELTDPNYFYGNYLETWPDMLDMTEFLMQYEILGNAEKWAREMKEVLEGEWRLVVKRACDEAIATEDGQVCEHPGELLWETGRKVVGHVRENLLDRVNGPWEPEQETEYVPAPPSTRSEVDLAISQVPRPRALLLRAAIFVSAMALFWSGAHLLLSQIAAPLVSIPAYVTGSVLTVLILIAGFHITYFRRVHILRWHLGSYLGHLRDTWTGKINNLERELLAEFLHSASVHVRDRFRPRAQFFNEFEQLLKRSAVGAGTDLPGSSLTDAKGKIEPGETNIVERIYLNRLIVFEELQQLLESSHKPAYRGALSCWIPDRDGTDGRYIERLHSLALETGTPEFRCILQPVGRPEDIALFAKLDFREELWKQSGEEINVSSERVTGGDSGIEARDRFIEDYVRLLVRRCAVEMNKKLDNDQFFWTLSRYLDLTSFEFDPDMFNELRERSKRTFHLTPSPGNPERTILAGKKEYFKNSAFKDLTLVMDENCYMFVELEGPLLFSDIEW